MATKTTSLPATVLEVSNPKTSKLEKDLKSDNEHSSFNSFVEYSTISSTSGSAIASTGKSTMADNKPLTPDQLCRLSSILDELRCDMEDGAIDSQGLKRYLARFSEVIGDRQDLMEDSYIQWFCRACKEEVLVLDVSALRFSRVETRHKLLTIDLTLSFDFYVKASMTAEQFRRYDSIWKDMSRLTAENRYGVEESINTWRRFAEMFRPHEHLMNRLSEVWFPHHCNDYLSTGGRKDRNHYLPRI